MSSSNNPTYGRAGLPWDDNEDNMLMYYGIAVGYELVARHDLNRPPQEGLDRIAWLRANKPKLVAYVQAQVNLEERETIPRDMRRRENRIRKH